VTRDEMQRALRVTAVGLVLVVAAVALGAKACGLF
jgi:hypothetical protein